MKVSYEVDPLTQERLELLEEMVATLTAETRELKALLNQVRSKTNQTHRLVEILCPENKKPKRGRPPKTSANKGKS
jgi:hypothetical protein